MNNKKHLGSQLTVMGKKEKSVLELGPRTLFTVKIHENNNSITLTLICKAIRYFSYFFSNTTRKKGFPSVKWLLAKPTSSFRYLLAVCES